MQINSELALAYNFIQHTGTHLFLTGKAGTGKTTFLKQLKASSPKRMVVVAPTGIAAINAGGVTIHSFFQLSFAPFLPNTTFSSGQYVYKFGKEKINIIRSLDLLVIDEVSMVRADLLDAIDAVLRKYRDKDKPFGGVQLLMIGDLQQLSPVVKEEEAQMLQSYYDTHFFFSSHALKETDYVTIELTHVYRQSDTKFISLLNKVRDNQIDATVLQELNKRYIPNFHPKEEEGYILLTTHNYQAQRINDAKLQELPDRSFTFRALIQGSFPESSFPTEERLVLKKNAQVMFIKNDSSSEKRFFNGKIGRIVNVSANRIEVLGNGDTTSFTLEPEEWTNAKYSLDTASKEIREVVEGTFKQYPLKTAWAITIHKSQGLTFERAIIDANSSFAHGQVYVALSRCKTLEGLVLSSPLVSSSIISDETISQFTKQVEENLPTERVLLGHQRAYYYEQLSEQFNFRPLEHALARVMRIMDEHLYRLYPKQVERYKVGTVAFNTKISNVAESFKVRFTTLFLESDTPEEDGLLNERITSGAAYFYKELNTILLPLMEQTAVETDNKELKKKFIEAFDSLKEAIRIKLFTLDKTCAGFTVTAYLKAKALCSIQEEKQKERTKKSKQETVSKVAVSEDIVYPRLFQRLKEWRNDEASRLGMPVYTVIQQKAMVGIANTLPRTKAELQRIPYFGAKGTERYGDALLEMVKEFVEKHKHPQE